jgi:hypothetical protein
MRPLHPCVMCGHEFAEECRSVAEELPLRARAHCPHCRDECVPILRAGPFPHEPHHDNRLLMPTPPH